MIATAIPPQQTLLTLISPIITLMVSTPPIQQEAQGLLPLPQVPVPLRLRRLALACLPLLAVQCRLLHLLRLVAR